MKKTNRPEMDKPHTLSDWAKKINYPTFSGAIFEVINKATNLEDGNKRLETVFKGLSDFGNEILDTHGFSLAKEELKKKFFKIDPTTAIVDLAKTTIEIAKDEVAKKIKNGDIVYTDTDSIFTK